MTPLSLGIFASANLSAAATSFESIATVTVGSGGAADVTFTSIGTDWTHLQVRYLAQTNRGTFGRDLVRLEINSDTGANYASHYISGDGASASAGAETTGNAVAIRAGTAGTTTAGTYFFGGGIVDVLDYKNTNKYKTVRTLAGVDVNGTVGGAGGEAVFSSGLWLSTNAITALTFKPAVGTLFSQYSHFALYGIKVAS